MKKVDANHKTIVEGLRAIGATVRSTAMVGKGFPDIAVGHQGRNFFFEIKNPGMFPSKRKLTIAEEEFFESWRGQVNVIHSLDDALKLITTGD